MAYTVNRSSTVHLHNFEQMQVAVLHFWTILLVRSTL